jgi:hypothetical protein
MLQSNHTTNFYWWIMGRDQATDINIYCKVLHRVLYPKRTEMDSKKKKKSDVRISMVILWTAFQSSTCAVGI